MSSCTRLVTADIFTGQYKDRPTFIASILSRLKIAAKQDGWPGIALFDADWIEERGKQPMAVIHLQQGTGDVSVADVRIAVIEKQRQRRRFVAQEDAA